MLSRIVFSVFIALSVSQTVYAQVKHPPQAYNSTCTAPEWVLSGVHNPKAKTTSVTILAGGQKTTVPAQGFQLLNKNDVVGKTQNAMLVELAKYYKINLSNLSYASVFIISQATEGSFLWVNYLNSKYESLGGAGVSGMSPFQCVKKK